MTSTLKYLNAHIFTIQWPVTYASFAGGTFCCIYTIYQQMFVVVVALLNVKETVSFLDILLYYSNKSKVSVRLGKIILGQFSSV